MENIKHAIEQLKSTEIYRSLVDNFAHQKFEERFENDTIQRGAWRSYRGFKIISDTKIEIEFSYGGGDIEFDDSFIVDLDVEK